MLRRCWPSGCQKWSDCCWFGHPFYRRTNTAWTEHECIQNIMQCFAKTAQVFGPNIQHGHSSYTIIKILTNAQPTVKKVYTTFMLCACSVPGFRAARQYSAKIKAQSADRTQASLTAGRHILHTQYAAYTQREPIARKILALSFNSTPNKQQKHSINQHQNWGRRWPDELGTHIAAQTERQTIITALGGPTV